MVVVPLNTLAGRSPGSVCRNRPDPRKTGGPSARFFGLAGEVASADCQREAKPGGQDDTGGPDLDLTGVGGPSVITTGTGSGPAGRNISARRTAPSSITIPASRSMIMRLLLHPQPRRRLVYRDDCVSTQSPVSSAQLKVSHRELAAVGRWASRSTWVRGVYGASFSTSLAPRG